LDEFCLRPTVRCKACLVMIWRSNMEVERLLNKKVRSRERKKRKERREILCPVWLTVNVE
jgi:hypothetical protein